MTETQITHTEN